MSATTNSPAPGYVVIGHVTKDLLADGSAIAGGTALYAALTASRLGVQAGVVSALAQKDSALLEPFHQQGISIVVRPSECSTTFVNHYESWGRWQELHGVAATIEREDVPASWTHAPILHLGPVAQEIAPNPSWVDLFPSALVGVTPQGWLRTWDENDRVMPTDWPGAADLLPRVHVLVMSAEDVGNNIEVLMRYVKLAPLAIVTAGADPATIYEYGREKATVPAVHANPVDFTGAGDVFTAAFLVRYQETGNPVTAAEFAHAVAALAIEAPGSTGIPQRSAVEQRLVIRDA